MSPDARVGIVLVSHSAALAEGAAELAAQISGGTVAIIPAGGTDGGQLGTSAAKVQRAVKLANSGAGVVILPDLGSAVLTVRALLAEAGDLPTPVELTGDLHARPAGALAVAAAKFSSAVSLTVGVSSTDAKSVLGVMGLGATSGQHVTVTAEGPDAEEAVATIVAILAEATRVGA